MMINSGGTKPIGELTYKRGDLGEVESFYHLNHVWNDDMRMVLHAKQFKKMIYRNRAVPEQMTLRERRRAGRNEEEAAQVIKRRKIDDYAYMGSFEIIPPPIATTVEYDGIDALYDVMMEDEQQERQQEVQDAMNVEEEPDAMEVDTPAPIVTRGFNVNDPATTPIAQRTRAQLKLVVNNADERPMSQAIDFSDESDHDDAQDDPSPQANKYKRKR